MTYTIQRWIAPICMTLAITLAGCASTPSVAEGEYSMARAAIDNAQNADAGEFAGGELLLAERKLQQARTRQEEGDAQAALQLLEESRLHAELAESIATKQKAQNSLDEINAGLATLQQELRRR